MSVEHRAFIQLSKYSKDKVEPKYEQQATDLKQNEQTRNTHVAKKIAGDFECNSAK